MVQRVAAGGEDDGAVFRALADPTRRAILDRLAVRDGQTIVQLTNDLGELSRFGVRKHLGVLEAAGIVVARKVGRERHHHLNPVPIRVVHDRWLSRFTSDLAGRLTALKHQLENPMSEPEPLVHVAVVNIRCTPEKVFEAFARNDLVGQWCHGVHYEPEGPWEVGAHVVEKVRDGTVVAEVDILEWVEFTRISVHITPQFHGGSPAPYRQTWDLEQRGEVTTVTVTCDGFEPDSPMFAVISGGMRSLLDSLKSLLETGAALAWQ